ncbi:MAG: endolytic transglycosylase MltG [Treponema sp.]|jgi:UPF0755 protein|nr:endolytic transglycosylase MltG [Treponema sp.]
MPPVIRFIAKILSVFISVFLLLFALAVGAFVYANSPPPAGPREGEGLRLEEDGSVLLEVRRGESSLSVGKRLEESGIIRTRYLWHLLSYFKKEYIKSGSYRLEIPAKQTAIHALLVQGRQMLVRVTVPEGITLKKAARIFEDSGICGAGDFLQAAADREILDWYRVPGETMEGCLFPDTYLFPKDYPADRVIRAMADNFFLRLEAFSGPAGSPALLPPDELYRAVILASIVEREYRVDEEAPLMAGVFYNRLRIGMALQSCATVEYVITEIQGKPHPETLYTRDTEIRDPYNTYLRPGLPPGPICSPGAVALDAVFNPASSEFLYFRLIDPQAGRHYFSRTLDDHIRAGVFYLKGSGSRP